LSVFECKFFIVLYCIVRGKVPWGHSSIPEVKA